jgi:hypothetical protein
MEGEDLGVVDPTAEEGFVVVAAVESTVDSWGKKVDSWDKKVEVGIVEMECAQV